MLLCPKPDDLGVCEAKTPNDKCHTVQVRGQRRTLTTEPVTSVETGRSTIPSGLGEEPLFLVLLIWGPVEPEGFADLFIVAFMLWLVFATK
jgi:hypothetical protein